MISTDFPIAIQVNYLSNATSTAIIRCPRAHYKLVWAALTFMTKLPKPANTAVVVKIVRVSGTIKKSEEEVIRQAKKIIERARRSEESEGTGGPIADIMKAVGKRKENEVMVAVDDDGGESESE